MSSNQLTITDLGLTSINRKIINDRKFSSNLITTVGDLPVRDGVVSDFSKNSYLTKSGLSIYGDKVTITFEGNFFSSSNNYNQVAWYLLGSTNPIVFQFVNNCPQVVLPTNEVIDFNYIPFTDETYFKAIVTLTSTSCEAVIDIYNDIFKESRTLASSINLSDFTNLYIGNNPTKLEAEEDYFWEGSVNLTSFSIANEDITFFTPTTGYSLNFTNIVVSDGSIELPSTTPRSIVKHLYSYDIEQSQIVRSNSTLLLTTQLSEESRLVIREIGLYAESDGKTFLFGYIRGLNVNKSSDVPYDLFLTVNLILNVVNVVGFPDANSFILNKIKPALLKDYIKIKNVNAYLIENLERIIRMNSLQPIPTEGYCGRYAEITKEYNGSYSIEYKGGIKCCDNPTSIQSIGYNTPQVTYRVQKRINEQQDCYSSIQTYSKLHKNIKVITKDVFNPDSMNSSTKVNSQITDFNDYPDGISINAEIYNSEQWKLYSTFSISDYASHNRTVISLNQTDNTQQNIPETPPTPIFSVANNSSTYTPYLSIDINTSNSLIATHYSDLTTLYAWIYYETPPEWVDGANIPLHIIYTKEETISSLNTKLYNNAMEEITPNENGFHIEQDGNSYIIKYGANTTTYIIDFNLKYYENPTSTTLIQNLNINKKYYINIEYLTNNSVSIATSEDGETYSSHTLSNLFEINKINTINVGENYYCNNVLPEPPEGTPANTLMGIVQQGDINGSTVYYLTCTLGTIETYNVFMNGTIDLMDWSIEQENNNWLPYINTVIKDAELLQYYHLPDYSKLSYTIHDICNPEYTMTFLDNRMTGNTDLINLSNPMSLCFKIDLMNDESKLLLAKVSDDERLFKLEFIKTVIVENDQTAVKYNLTFTLNTNDDPVIIDIPIDKAGIEEYINNPILITIIYKNSTLYMYRNNELIGSTTVEGTIPSYTDSHLTNYISEYSNAGRYVKEIIVMSGTLSADELYYITNLTDTNFKFANVSNTTLVQNVSEE